jgi:hypothetical protein
VRFNLINDVEVLAIQPFDEKDLGKTSRVVRKFSDQPLTQADAHGLFFIKDLGVASCWSTNRHLGLNGPSLVIQAV